MTVPRGRIPDSILAYHGSQAVCLVAQQLPDAKREEPKGDLWRVRVGGTLLQATTHTCTLVGGDIFTIERVVHAICVALPVPEDKEEQELFTLVRAVRAMPIDHRQHIHNLICALQYTPYIRRGESTDEQDAFSTMHEDASNAYNAGSVTNAQTIAQKALAYYDTFEIDVPRLRNTLEYMCVIIANCAEAHYLASGGAEQEQLALAIQLRERLLSLQRSSAKRPNKYRYTVEQELARTLLYPDMAMFLQSPQEALDFIDQQAETYGQQWIEAERERRNAKQRNAKQQSANVDK